MTDITVPAPTPKPGFKTSEFWLVLLANVVGLLLMSGAFGETSTMGKALTFAAQALTTAGYSYGRSLLKAAA